MDDWCIIIGGEDDCFDLLVKWVVVLLCKVGKLMDWLYVLVFDIQLELVFSWVGMFVEIDDGLFFVGNVLGYDLCVYFVMVYGGNGIIYSMIVVVMVCDVIQGRWYLFDVLFGFGCLVG